MKPISTTTEVSLHKEHLHVQGKMSSNRVETLNAQFGLGVQPILPKGIGFTEEIWREPVDTGPSKYTHCGHTYE